MTDLSKKLTAPIRRINHYDANIYKREGKYSSNETESLIFRESIKYAFKSLKIEIRFNGEYAALQIKTSPGAGVYSINEPDWIMFTRTPKHGATSVGRWPLFVQGDVIGPETAKMVDSISFRKLLSKLDLTERESLHFYGNGANFYTKQCDVEGLVKRAEYLFDFLEQHRHSVNERIIELPIGFKDLNGIARDWAISDDAERDEAIENATIESLRKLVEDVAPRLAEINEYLSIHSNDEAADLEALAQAALEAEIFLKQSKQ